MDRGESAGGIEADFERLLPAQADLVDQQRGQIHALDVLHDEVPDATDHIAVEDAHDLRIVDAKARAGLVAQAANRGIGRLAEAMRQESSPRRNG